MRAILHLSDANNETPNEEIDMSVTSKPSTVAGEVAKWVHGRYHGMWSFVDSRIQRALIADAVLAEVRMQDESMLESKSAQWLADRIELWSTEAITLLASAKYRMPVSE